MSEKFSETVEILDSKSNTRITLDGNQGDIIVQEKLGIIPSSGESGGGISTGGSPISGEGGKVVLSEVMKFDASESALYIGSRKSPGKSSKFPGKAGNIFVRNGAGNDVFHINGEYASLSIGGKGNEGDISVKDGAGRLAFHVNGEYASLIIGCEGNEGDIKVKDNSGNDVFHINGSNASLSIGGNGNEGDISVKDGPGRLAFHVNG